MPPKNKGSKEKRQEGSRYKEGADDVHKNRLAWGDYVRAPVGQGAHLKGRGDFSISNCREKRERKRLVDDGGVKVGARDYWETQADATLLRKLFGLDV
jgi:hypothetical protein